MYLTPLRRQGMLHFILCVAATQSFFVNWILTEPLSVGHVFPCRCKIAVSVKKQGSSQIFIPDEI